MPYERVLAISARHQKLLDLVRSGEHSAQDLAEILGVSEQTIYRDINSLKDRGYSVRSVKSGQTWAYQLPAEPAPA
jgi:DeoR/GlpR family transcriptional regulator of sugar metabolism